MVSHEKAPAELSLPPGRYDVVVHDSWGTGKSVKLEGIDLSAGASVEKAARLGR